MVPRVDVFSTKGGVGKTTLAFYVAQAQAQHAKAPVLLVDADLTGTCLGELLQPWVVPRWHQVQPNLIHLVCGPPERLEELLRDPEKLPVYEYHSVPPPGEPRARRAPRGLDKAGVLFCPSHENSLPEVAPAVLHALLGHESAGGWVNHVIERLVEATRQHIPALAAVVVDHGPGIGALQEATMRTLEAKLAQGGTQRTAWRALVVTTRDGVDLSATADLDARMQSSLPLLKEQVVWVVNRASRATEGQSWREAVTAPLFKGIRPVGDWFQHRALPVYQDDALSDAYRRSELHRVGVPSVELAPLRTKLFGE